ncbi:hypothetical protein [Corynebacterium callunae]|uniref:hypothetical protein n=1 Tax=Corynebacterium callunae TaxID=1721 RepID=UPI001FFE8F49|nr:hypothetical protein [Corynebacterium callunae]MCK2199153.1 hypothetical protein [Corynebacterium callunae]
MSDRNESSNEKSSINLAVWIIAGLLAILAFIAVGNVIEEENAKTRRSQELVHQMEQDQEELQNDLYNEMTHK